MNYEAQTYTNPRDQRLSFRDVGQGRPVVWLHSGVPGATAERDFAANIDAFGARHRLILINLPFNRPVAAGDGAAQSAGALVGELLVHLQIEKASVIGNGLGGEVAFNLAADSPDAVGRLVLIAPTGCRFSPFTPVPMEGMKAIASYWAQPSAARMTSVLRLLRADPNSVEDAESMERHTAAISDVAAPALSRDDRDAMLLAPLVNVPTMLMWGREDRFSPMDYGLNLLARMPDARFHLLPHAGHNAQLDAAPEVNALLRDFLEDRS